MVKSFIVGLFILFFALLGPSRHAGAAALSDGDRIVTTAPHPFYVIGKGFTEARSLRAFEQASNQPRSHSDLYGSA